jgi:glycosyltransferase involved in cell wall biosynthesis
METTDKKIRLMWHSNAPWVNTGYGVQTRHFVPRIKAMGYETAVLAYFGLAGGMLNLNGIPIYPMLYQPFGNDVLTAHSGNFGANVLMTLTDTWILDPNAIAPGLRWIPWYPIDHIDLPGQVKRNLLTAYRRIAMSKFGQKLVQDAGMPSYYIPHGVDTNVFKPMDKVECRKQLGWPQDKYIMGMVAMNKGNPSRKSFVEILTAFANFRKVHTDAMFYAHTAVCENRENDGVNLIELCRQLGLQVGKDVLFPDQYMLTIGIPDVGMALMYNAIDVHVLVSTGEGFGIPILEAQACGTPVIVGDWTAMSELCFSGRLIDKSDADPVYTGLNAYQLKPRIRAIELAMHAEYKNPSPHDKAVRHAAEYDVNVVAEKYWKPVLEEINNDYWHDFEKLSSETEAAKQKSLREMAVPV